MANLIQSAKAQVSQLTAQAYEAAVAAGVLPAGVELKGSVEIPKDPQNGDYASSVAMAGAKAMKMAPRAIAQALVDHMDLAGTIFSSVEIAGPGFLNFRLGHKWYGDVLAEIEKEGPLYTFPAETLDATVAATCHIFTFDASNAGSASLNIVLGEGEGETRVIPVELNEEAIPSK